MGMLKPYYEHAGIWIYCGDCREILPDLVARPLIDLVLTDPPYGINYRSTHNSGWRSKRTAAMWRRDGDFDGIIGDDLPLDPAHLLAIGRQHVIFGGNYCADKLPTSRCWIVWDKNCDKTPSNQADCELIWTDFDAPSRVYRHLWRGIMRDGAENVSRSVKLHPHQKPVALLRFILGYWAVQYPQTMNGPALILDPYCGSGSVLLAAKERGHKAIGIEIEEKYCEIATKRLSQEVFDFPD